jgi:uncharacterized membrane protein HdeD (DUF308 family)
MTIPGTPTLLPHLWKTTLVSGVLAIALGVAILAWPGISISIATIFFGIALLLTGFQQIFLGFTLRVSFVGRLLLFISGAAAVIVGVMALTSLFEGWRILAIWIGVGFIFRGIATTSSAISDPTLPGRGWNIFVGAITFIAGVVIMAFPYKSLATLALVVGVWLVAIGIMEIVTAFGIRRLTKAHSHTESTAGLTSHPEPPSR